MTKKKQCNIFQFCVSCFTVTFQKTRKTNIEFNWNFFKKKSFLSNLVMI